MTGPEKIPMMTKSIVDENIEKIRILFPNCVTEVSDNGEPRLVVDFDKLRQELSSSIVEGLRERYTFNWPDKSKAILLSNSPTTKTLRPIREKSFNFDSATNIYIEGDNLDVLKCLRESYFGKIKLIYIDPPYNTGKDFIYKDDYRSSVSNYLKISQQVNESGYVLDSNMETNGRFHTDWLNMMYPRLKISRDFLSEDGAIFISIDDNETANLIKIADEIFGESNRIAQLVIENNPRGRQSDTFFATSHEYLLCYAKNILKCRLNGDDLTTDDIKDYKYEDGFGSYRLLGLRQRGVASLREDRPEMFFPIWVNPDNLSISFSPIAGWECVVPKKSDGREGRWMWGKAKCENELDRLVARYIAKRQEYDIFVKDYLHRDGEQRSKKFKTVWSEKNLNNQNGKRDLKERLGGDFMSYPKSLEFIKKIVKLGTDQDSIILDFFSGSATTADAVLQVNLEDSGDRKFILVQIPEKLATDSLAFKSGFETICDIGRTRLIEAVKEIENSDSLYQNKKIGFRYFRCDSSNFSDVAILPNKTDQKNLLFFVDNVKPDRSAEDLLFFVLTSLGAALDCRIEVIPTFGKNVFNVENGYIVACFDKVISNEIVESVAEMQPIYAIFRDECFEKDSVTDNFEQIFKTLSPRTICKVI